MAILDTEYVKAPSLWAGDLSITKSSTGFRIFEGNTVFLTGDADGTLTIGKENLTSSIHALRINAAEIYWNNRSLEDYWEGESGGIVPDLTQDVTALQELTAANTKAIQDTDKRLSQELSDLRMDALGAKINTLVQPINNYVSNICGIAVPVTLLKEALPYFNKITLNNVQNSGTGYLAIYACDVETPSVASPCTLLYVAEEALETTGTPTAPTSSVINIPDKINVPDSGFILLIFSSSSTAPQADNISWVAEDNSTMVIRMGIYSPGGTNRPYDTNGEYVLQKVTNAAFLTYSPDIDFSYVYDETENILSKDIEEIKSQIVDLRSDVEDRMTYEETLDVVTEEIEELRSDLEDYMTYDETMEAIAAFPDDSLEGRLYNLGGLVDALTAPATPLTLIKKVDNSSSSIKFNDGVISLASASDLQEELTAPTSITELKLTSGIAQLTISQYTPLSDDLLDVASLNMHSVSSSESEAGTVELKSSYRKHLAPGTYIQSITYLTSEPGKLKLGIKDDDQDVFKFLVQSPYVENPDVPEEYVPVVSASGVQLIYRSATDIAFLSKLNMDDTSATLSVFDSLRFGSMAVKADRVVMETKNASYYSTVLTLDYKGTLALASVHNPALDMYITPDSSVIPTISIVYHLIQQALANQ